VEVADVPSIVMHPDTSYTLPASGGGHVPEAVVITVGEVVYTLTAQNPVYIEPAHLASVQAQLTSIFGTLANAPVCTLVVTGGAAGSYSYQVVPFNDQGDDLPPTATSTAAGPTTLDATHYVTVNWTTIPNAKGYKVIRTAGGPSQGLIATLVGAVTFRDDNSEGAATVYTPSAANPANVGWYIQPSV
jgi:hypothetical protein